MFDWRIFFTYLPILARTSVVTVEVVFFSTLFASLLGLVVAAMCMSKNKLLCLIAQAYIHVVRGIPLLVQILWMFFGITLFFGVNMEPIPAGILIMSLWGGAYFAEIFRGGLNAIQRTQYYAAYAAGMTPFQCYLHVVLPQAFRKIAPPFISQLIVMTKSSSLLSVINVQEITKRADTMSVALYAPFEVYLAAGLVYFVILFVIARFGKFAEDRLRVNTLEG